MRRNRYDEIKKMAEVLRVRSATESQALLDLLAEVPVPPVEPEKWSLPLSHRFTDADYERLLADASALVESEPDDRKQGTFSLVVNILRELRADLALMEDALKGRVVVDGVEWVRLPSNQWKAMVHDLYVQESCTGEWSEAYSSAYYPTLLAAMRAAKAGE